MKQDHLEVLLEDNNEKLQRLVEGMSVLQKDVRQVKSDLNKLEGVPADIKVIKAAIKDQTGDYRKQEKQLKNHELRITGLEQAA